MIFYRRASRGGKDGRPSGKRPPGFTYQGHLPLRAVRTEGPAG